MGFIDKLDTFLTGARARSAASREAAAFERACKPGVSYFSIEECEQPWGNEPMAREWVFKRSKLGSLSCGPHSPAYIWLNYGPLMEDPGPHIKPLFETSSGGRGPTEKELQKALDVALAALTRTRKDLQKVRG